MAAKKKRSRSEGPRKAASKRGKKAVPPPDNPLQRQLAEEAAHGGVRLPEHAPGLDSDTARIMARKRAEALEQTQRMPRSGAPLGSAPPSDAPPSDAVPNGALPGDAAGSAPESAPSDSDRG